MESALSTSGATLRATEMGFGGVAAFASAFFFLPLSAAFFPVTGESSSFGVGGGIFDAVGDCLTLRATSVSEMTEEESRWFFFALDGVSVSASRTVRLTGEGPGSLITRGERCTRGN